MDKTIKELAKNLKKNGDKAAVDKLESTICGRITEAVKEKSFYNLPTKEISKIIKGSEIRDVNTRDINGLTILHYASKYGNLKVVKYLVEQCHANIEANDNYENALH